jgi:predicted MFS family arabinose efflux permease
MILLYFAGFGMMQCASVSNMVIQSLVSEDKRARVMSYYTTAFFGSAPVGSLIAGGLADRIGAPHTVMVTGAFCLLGTLWFTSKLPTIKGAIAPVYQELAMNASSGSAR